MSDIVIGTLLTAFCIVFIVSFAVLFIKLLEEEKP